LPGTNGSARICFADGTEAIVGVKAELEKIRNALGINDEGLRVETEHEQAGETVDKGDKVHQEKGENNWAEVSIEIPGFRDDDALPVFLASMLSEALLASGDLLARLRINRRFHWKLYIDVRDMIL
jgi:exosome complex component RRP42